VGQRRLGEVLAVARGDGDGVFAARARGRVVLGPHRGAIGGETRGESGAGGVTVERAERRRRDS
jgi:hypothetical protein